MVAVSLLSCITLVASQDEFLSRHTQVCTMEVRKCPDGSLVGRDSNNDCNFHPCPSGEVVCSLDTKQCPDGSWVSRDSAHDCEFQPCPEGPVFCCLAMPVCREGFAPVEAGDPECQSNPEKCEDVTMCCTTIKCKQLPPTQVCTQETRDCPDGSSVGRDSNNDCEFHSCPGACDLIPRDGKGREMCKQRPDCEVKEDGSCGEMVPCDTDAGCQPDEHCRSAAGDIDFWDCQDHKVCVKRVAIGGTCGGFGVSCTFEKCQTGLTCKGNDQLPDLPGVCVEEIVKETCETPIKKWQACLGRENCCETGTHCRRFSKWYAQCNPNPWKVTEPR